MMTLIGRFMAIAILVFWIPLFWYQSLEPQTAKAPISLAQPEIAGFGDNASHVVAVNDPKLRGEISPGDTIGNPPMSRTSLRITLGILQGPTTIEVHHDGTIRSLTLSPTTVSSSEVPSEFALVSEIITLLLGTTVMLIAAVILWRKPGEMSLFFAWFAVGAPIDTLLIARLALGAPEFVFHAVYTLALLACGLGPTLALTAFALRFPEGRITVAERHWAQPVDAALVVTLAVYAIEAWKPMSFGWIFANAVPLAATALTLAIVIVKFGMSTGEKRQRISWALFGVAVSSVGYAAAGNPEAFLYNVPVASAVASVLVGALPLFLGYAILRHRVMDIGFALNRSLVYACVTATIVIGISAVDWLSSRYLAGTKISLALDAAIAIAFGVALNQIHSRIERGVDQVLFRERHRAWTRIESRIRALDFAETSDTVDAALVDETAHVLRLTSAAVFRSGESGDFIRTSAVGWEGGATTLPREHLLLRTLQSEERTVALSEHAIEGPEFPGGAHCPDIAIPIGMRHQLLGCVIYGHRQGDTTLDSEERSLLERLAHAAAVAYDAIEAANWRNRALMFESPGTTRTVRSV
jgi:hypothetical protein